MKRQKIKDPERRSPALPGFSVRLGQLRAALLVQLGQLVHQIPIFPPCARGKGRGVLVPHPSADHRQPDQARAEEPGRGGDGNSGHGDIVEGRAIWAEPLEAQERKLRLVTDGRKVKLFQSPAHISPILSCRVKRIGLVFAAARDEEVLSYFPTVGVSGHGEADSVGGSHDRVKGLGNPAKAIASQIDASAAIGSRPVASDIIDAMAANRPAVNGSAPI